MGNHHVGTLAVEGQPGLPVVEDAIAAQPVIDRAVARDHDALAEVVGNEVAQRRFSSAHGIVVCSA